jgi:hypothetical protein
VRGIPAAKRGQRAQPQRAAAFAHATLGVDLIV